MCYKRPGPRCSDHTRQELQAAKKAYNEKPSRENLEALKKAKQEYMRTPRGIAALERRAEATDDLLKKRRLIEASVLLRESRGAALAKLKELHPEEFAPGKASPEDRALVAEWERRQEALAASSPDHRRQREVGKRYSAEEGFRMASDPNTTAEVLTELAFHPEREVRWEAVERDELPEEGLRFIARDRTPGLRQKVAWHRNAGGALINSMVDDPDEYVRGGVAHSGYLTPANASKLSHDKSEYVRGWVAANPVTPAPDLVRLATEGDASESVSVRAAVADNPMAPDAVLTHLSKDPSERVRLAAKEQLAMRSSYASAATSTTDESDMDDDDSDDFWDSVSLSSRL